MNYWLIKSEEEEYSIDDLKRDGKVAWFGVRNYQARNFMRDSMNINDFVFFYHSNGNPSGIVGVGKVTSLPYPDATQFDPTSPYYYPRASKEKPVWILVDISYIKKYRHMLTITKMRSIEKIATMSLLQKGSRLSITPVSEKDFIYIDKLLSQE